VNKPNFFIVGAPKCGTTAMNHFLAQHPDIFMAKKEIHFFGGDLKMQEVPSEQEYLQYFEEAGNKKIIGEASVWYLYSKTAALEIKKFNPDAKILIMLRNPVEVIYSLHSQHLYNYNEDVRDFEKALALDEVRKKGNHLPDSVDFYELPPYKDSVLFFEQVNRYLSAFGEKNVHIVLYDDFKTKPEQVYKETVSFLGLREFEDIDFKIINPNKKMRSWVLHRSLKKPSRGLKNFARWLIPFKPIRHRIMFSLFKFNIYSKRRKKMDEQIRIKLVQLFKNDIHELSRLLQRDLSSWTK
jgi:Sulfotransferase domain